MQSSATSHIIHFFSCQCSTLHHPLRPIPFSSATFLASLFLMPVQHSAPPTKAYTIFFCNISLFILFSFLRVQHSATSLFLFSFPFCASAELCTTSRAYICLFCPGFSLQRTFLTFQTTFPLNLLVYF